MNGRTAIDVALRAATDTYTVTAETELTDVTIDVSIDTSSVRYDNIVREKVKPFIPMSPKQYGQMLQGRKSK